MAYSEKGFGARVENAQQLLSHMNNMDDYKASSTDLSQQHLEQLIESTRKFNELAIDTWVDYKRAMHTRNALYKKEPASLEKLATPINAAVRAAFGRQSQQATTIAALIRKIRGAKLKKWKTTPDIDAISQSERSFGSLTKLLSDIIIIVDKYSDQYNPGNPNIQPDALKTLLTNMEQANKKVTVTITKQKSALHNRSESYGELHKITQRIKDAIKSQYTGSSVQYSLVKKLVI